MINVQVNVYLKNKLTEVKLSFMMNVHHVPKVKCAEIKTMSYSFDKCVQVL